MLDLGKLDVDEIATALSDQTDYEHRWLIDPLTGEIADWTSDIGIDSSKTSLQVATLSRQGIAVERQLSG